MSHFNQLTPAELERLAKLSEELGEATQAIGKILRHGYESYNPTIQFPKSNRQDLERELGDILFAIDLLCEKNDVNLDNIENIRNFNRHKNMYFHHQD